MANLMIRNLPDEVHLRLKEKAKRNRRSLNQEVIAELLASAGESPGSTKQERVLQMVALAAELRKGLKYPLTPEEIRAAIEEGRK
jgi:antitoxin FitA